ncbi:MAG: ankyrin repeat domain-containing protein, partial [Rickettsiaceae bacterium]|nr:ankyrin repeat domain-containing protein [Rickettsiaceae bacterium]
SNDLFESVKNWDTTAVREHLDKGANTNMTYTDCANNTTGNSLIMLAVATYKIVSKEKKNNINNIDLIELLIDHGCDIYAQNSQGKTVIDLVESLSKSSNLYKRISKEQAYVESKAKYDSLKDSAKKEEINKNLLDILKRKPGTSLDYITNRKELIKLISQKSVDVNIKDSDGNTPLMLAAQNHRDSPDSRYLNSIVRIIIKCGADINAENNNGKTALDLTTHFTNHLEELRAEQDSAAENSDPEVMNNPDSNLDNGERDLEVAQNSDESPESDRLLTGQNTEDDVDAY